MVPGLQAHSACLLFFFGAGFPSPHRPFPLSSDTMTADQPEVAGATATTVSSVDSKLSELSVESADASAAAAAAAAAPTTIDMNAPFINPDGTPMTKNQIKNEEKRRAKMEKFLAKQAKQSEKAAAAKDAPKKAPKVVKAPVEIPVDNTPKGSKKDTAAQFPSSYHPTYVESAWYSWWQESGFFKPEYSHPNLDAAPEDTFTIVIPPPNVTGSLHLGHALTNAVEDSLVRWNRMNGKMTLWLPGTDHAGIATQSAVERQLYRETGQTRHDLGREKFIEKIWAWKDRFGNRICDQISRLGCSVDWSRHRFTMDPSMSEAVTEAFVRLFEKGYIYRTTRLVNWCPHLRTALSNLEVDHMELTEPTMLKVPGHGEDKRYEFGVLIKFAYKLADEAGQPTDEEIVVATTRIETMLGDTGIIVNPADPRYEGLVGRSAVHPFLGHLIPIRADESVDIEFGTGAVKITPAHDPNDYEMHKKHGFELVTIFSDDGRINARGGQFEGLMRFDAREAVIAALKEKGLYRETVSNPMSIPICSRSGDVIEPMPKPQWYVKTDEFSAQAADAVRSGKIQILPEGVFDRTWFHWMESPQDWCISRQLWWGHQIPVYRVTFVCEALEASTPDDDARWIAARSADEALDQAAKNFGVARDQITVEQDSDVLDTWFSSGLFPFATMGWPNAESPDLKAFFPNSILETGHDIIFFWVARMVMMSLALTGEVPFSKVFLHAMVRDAHGRKMSKSLGNVIDPIHMIEGVSLQQLHDALDADTNLPASERQVAKQGQRKDFPKGIGECGTDALRFALCAYTLQPRDINLDVKRVEAYRNFCNKIWNGFRFAMDKFDASFQPSDAIPRLETLPSLADRWIIARLNACIQACNEGLEQFNFADPTQALYAFFMNEFCDVYLEWTKPVFLSGSDAAKADARQVLYNCLDVYLRLMHPFMPYITEELYQRLPRRAVHAAIPSIMVSPYPKVSAAEQEAEAEASATATSQFDLILELARVIRQATAEHAEKPRRPDCFVATSAEHADLFRPETESILSIARAASLSLVDDAQADALAAEGLVFHDLTMKEAVVARVAIRPVVVTA
ncbi:valyl-tRNA synthetase [Fonticula alba]|uniref:Valine--tRNA ligase, mitochondrial n=1 Tax=Fonticula alba TaxID=691883 RepID=A0A058ZDT6_FONAL|nr:valyl-tRNA synthetase [Fonticula alba]KCV72560.1 valyl-tRNA synthetase [Fonticula alba]|eukprot:XP_009492261.1 valyl-tRNA synthetase [Fonticula alba]